MSALAFTAQIAAAGVRNPRRLIRYTWWGRPVPRKGAWPTDFGLWQSARMTLVGPADGGFRTMLIIAQIVFLAVLPFCLPFTETLGDPLRRLEEWGVVLVVSVAWLVVRFGARPVPQLVYRSCYFAYRYLFVTVPGRFGDTIDVAGYLLVYIAQLAIRFLGLALFLALFWLYELLAQKVFVQPFTAQQHFVIALFAAGGARVAVVFVCAFIRWRARRTGRRPATKTSYRRRFRNLEVQRSLVPWPWMNKSSLASTPARDPAWRMTYRSLRGMLSGYAWRETTGAPTTPDGVDSSGVDSSGVDSASV